MRWLPPGFSAATNINYLIARRNGVLDRELPRQNERRRASGTLRLEELAPAAWRYRTSYHEARGGRLKIGAMTAALLAIRVILILRSGFADLTARTRVRVGTLRERDRHYRRGGNRSHESGGGVEQASS